MGYRQALIVTINAGKVCAVLRPNTNAPVSLCDEKITKKKEKKWREFIVEKSINGNDYPHSVRDKIHVFHIIHKNKNRKKTQR